MNQIEVISEHLCSSFSFQIDDIILYVRKKQEYYQRYQLKKEIMIGREIDNHLIYLHHMVSKYQARIYFDQQWYIEDLQSKNGVYVNKRKIKKQRLRIGDWISIAGFDIYFCLVFLYCPKPDRVSLNEFQLEDFPYSQPSSRQLQLIEKVEYPKLDLYRKSIRHFSLIDDLAIPLIYPLMLIYHNQESIFLYITLWTFGFRAVGKFYLFFKDVIDKYRSDRNFKKHKEMYYSYLSNRFPTVVQLENNTYLMPFDSFMVRIGTRQQKIILHDFNEAKRLLIIGKKEKRIELIKQIVYQIERFYPTVTIHMDSIEYPFIMSYARLRDGDIHLGINQNDYEFTIWHLDCIEHHQKTYDAIIHLDEKWYFKDKKIDIQLDADVDDFIFSRNFHHTFEDLKITRTFIELSCLNQMDIHQIRKKYAITTSLIGMLGYQKNETIYLDLHEQKQGPHLLVAGMSGSGKSEWLTSFLLSIAIFYKSEDVQFFIIDFKGGGLCSLFEKLHHTCQVLSNLDQYQIYRTIAALEDELALRERILLKATEEIGEPVLDIHYLKKESQNKRCTYNLAHLIIVVDEFAELKLLYPEMMQSLVRIARTGRSLGIHLILCTQRPNGVVDRQIESNIQSRLCMKVASKQDSFDILGNDKAYQLKDAGEWICETSKGDIHGQTAWVDTREQPLILSDYHLNEKYRIPIRLESPKSMKISIIEQINDYTQKVKPLFVKNILDEQIPENALGIYDDYRHRKMVPFYKGTSLLILGGVINEIETYSKEKINYAKQLDSYDMVLFFDKKEVENLLMKKIPFEINKEKKLGAIYQKGMIYQCKIQYSVI